MEQQNSCADCLNLGRAVYCMQCVRMNKGNKNIPKLKHPPLLTFVQKKGGTTIAAKKMKE